MIADEAGVAGLLCLGYPFHPPGKPERLRTAHLETLETPTLILQGTRDPFGTREEVADLLAIAFDRGRLDGGRRPFVQAPEEKRPNARTESQEAAEAAIAFIQRLA